MLDTPRWQHASVAAFLLALLGWGAWLRLTYLGEPSFWIDEAFSLEVAHQWLQGVQAVDDWRAWPHRLLLAAGLQVSDESEWLARFPSVIAGVALVACIALWLWRRFGGLPALFAALVLSLHYWQIAWSRQAREYIFVTLALFVSLYVIDSLARRRVSLRVTAAVTVFLTFITASFHLFGLVVLIASTLRLALDGHYFPARSSRVISVTLILALTILALMGVRQHLQLASNGLAIYGGFLWQEYSELLLLCIAVLLVWRDGEKRVFSLWLLLFGLLGFLAIALAVPLINLRYLFFLTPALVLLVATAIPDSSRLMAVLYVLLACGWLMINERLVLTPKPDYRLEAQRPGADFRYYTPQPDFRDAYNYINNRLGAIDLVTPYPAVSRRYRNIDDTMALNANVQYPNVAHDERGAVEFYTGRYFASAPALYQLAEQVDEVYVLIDQMATQRIDGQITLLLQQFATPVQSWQKPPYSSLYLYRLTVPD